MDPIITNALMTFGAGFVGATFSKAKGPGQALDDAMSLIGFERLHEVAEKKRADREENIRRYKDSIAQKVVLIPEKNLQEPQLSIVGPALEASRFYIEEETLREMFANLISLSMDDRWNQKIHTSYVDIIKQLSPYDAIVLQKIKEEQRYVGSPYPVMKVIIKSPTEGIKTIFPLVVIFKNEIGFQQNTTAIENLNRLGIIKLSEQTWSAEDSDYDIYRNDLVINSVLDAHPNMELQRISFSLSSFGSNFIEVCVSRK